MIFFLSKVALRRQQAQEENEQRQLQSLMLNVNMQKSLAQNTPQNACLAEVTELEGEVKTETLRSSPKVEEKPRKRSFGEVDGGVEVDHAQGKHL